MEIQPQFQRRDGTSQAGRFQKALMPEYIPLDERSLKELLEFARQYSKELRYFNEKNEVDGDWSDFIRLNELDEIVAFLNDPEGYPSGALNRDRLTRPHLVLFVTFLELLQHAREQLNSLTRRHLEFYYRQALRLTSQKGTSDHVHVLVELSDGQDQFLLPAGTLFQAGEDSQGNALLYRSDEDLVANQAKVASLKSLYVKRQMIGIREARKNPDVLIEIFPENQDVLEEGQQKDRAFLAMLMMALGTPNPGQKLEAYPDGQIVDTALFAELDILLAFVSDNLYLFISTFRSLMELKNSLTLVAGQETPINQEWNQINDLLEKAGQARDPGFKLDRSTPDNFESNLLSALGRSEFGDLLNELPDVDNIYDLYRRLSQKNVGQDVIEFIPKSLYMSVDDFKKLMGMVEDINGRWRQIYEILRAARRKKDPAFIFKPPEIRKYNPDKFNALIEQTLGTITYPTFKRFQVASFDDCYSEVTNLESYFHMPAEKYVSIRKTAARPEAEVQAWEWRQVYAILEDAHAEKTLAVRKNELKSRQESAGFEAMTRFAFGSPNPGDALPDGKIFMELDAEKDNSYIQETLFLAPENFSYIKGLQSSKTPLNDPRWTNVYTILEQAQRRFRNWTMPPATVEKWENVYAADDATLAQVQTGAESKPVTPRWRTFGDDNPSAAAPGSIGFAIASPLLALAEGKRDITLTLDFHEDGFDQSTLDLVLKKSSPFNLLLSTAKKMITVEQVQVVSAVSDSPGPDGEKACQLVFRLTLDEQIPPITVPETASSLAAPWPFLQIMLADVPDQDKENAPKIKHYREFQALRLKKLGLEVSVAGITQLSLQNDDGTLDPKKPFTPFGIAPVVGSRFYFAHPELSSKKLDDLTLNFEWMGAPSNFNTYYLGYLRADEREIDPTDATNGPSTSPIANNAAFKAQVRLYDNRSFFDVQQIQLFDAYPAQIPGNTISASYKNYDRNPLAIEPTEEVTNWSRFWQLELLTPDFQHSVYPRAAAACANKIQPGTGTDPKPKPYIINPPYTPKLKHLSVGYKASVEIDFTQASPSIDNLYHIEPFGARDLKSLDTNPYPFLPQFENEGELYIGISGLVPPKNLSLLFQMAEGSANPDIAREAVKWSCLSGNQWHSLESGQLLRDTTNGLINAGILKFSLDPVTPSTLLPNRFYWIRAAIATNSRGVADTVAIKAQAVSATFEDHGNAADHLSQPLPAGKISELAESQPEVAAIQQPYSSFGGKSPEQAGSFYTRVSERLRHKDRALTCWDYEHMVLEAFPGIYKVKCLPVGSSDDPQLADVLQVVVIPDIRGKLPFDPFEPKAPADLLWQIESYLVKRSSPSARLVVKNPTYVRIRIRLSVRFRSGFNPGYYIDALNQELQQFLAPWAYDQSADIFFGGSINTSLIINFVEERPYIDYVAGIKVFTILDGGSPSLYDPEKAPSELAFAPDAILVSDRSHQIDLISEEVFEEEFFAGINYMKIELDFQVASE